MRTLAFLRSQDKFTLDRRVACAREDMSCEGGKLMHRECSCLGNTVAPIRLQGASTCAPKDNVGS
jgi:hypothetical protein